MLRWVAGSILLKMGSSSSLMCLLLFCICSCSSHAHAAFAFAPSLHNNHFVEGNARRRFHSPSTSFAKLSSSSNNHNNEETEIFYDDFSGMSIGEVSSSSFVKEEEEEEELPDFDFDEDNDAQNQKEDLVSIPLPKTNAQDDLTGSTLREFSFGPDILLSNYAGSSGFDKVTDWQYYATDDYTGERTAVSPNPMDAVNQPARTRSSSGSVVRLFRGEAAGKLASKLRSRGLDSRVWIKVREEKVGLYLCDMK